MGKFYADTAAWADKAWQRAEYVVRATVQDVAELASVARDGLVRGAPFQRGVVPVDEGELVGSLVVRIDGTTVATGTPGATPSPPDYTAALVGWQMGDELIIAYTADHARPIEYGFRIGADDTDDSTGDVDIPGRFMVSLAVQQFQTLADENARIVGA